MKTCFIVDGFKFIFFILSLKQDISVGCFLLKWERISVQILRFLQESLKYCDFFLNMSYERSSLSEI